MGELRFYLGKYPVEVLMKSKKNWVVLDLLAGKVFTTPPRLLWRRERL